MNARSQARNPSGSSPDQPKELLLWADDVRFLDEPGEAWVHRWSAGQGGAVLSAAGLAPGVFTMEVNTLPMWSERQVIRLRQAEEASEGLLMAISHYLDNPAPSTALLVEYVGDLRDKRLPAAWRDLSQKMTSRGCSVPAKQGKDYIRRRLADAGFTMTPQNMTALDEWAAGETARLVSALDILLLFKHGTGVIDAKDMAGLLGAGGTPQEWDLQDAFMAGDGGRFVRLLEAIRRDADAVPLAFLGMLAKQMRSLLLLRGLSAKGLKRREITPEMLGFRHPLPLNKLMAVADQWPESRLRGALASLYAIDLSLKGDPGDSWALLERGLLALLAR